MNSDFRGRRAHFQGLQGHLPITRIFFRWLGEESHQGHTRAIPGPPQGHPVMFLTWWPCWPCPLCAPFLKQGRDN